MFFFNNLQYFVLATLDSNGRPWVSILTGEQGFMKSISHNHLAIVTRVSDSDPILITLNNEWIVSEKGRIVAGLGIDLTNRRRNKGRHIEVHC